VRCDVGAERTPTSIAAREEYERLICGILLLVKLKLEGWAISDGCRKCSVLDLVRQFFVGDVMVKPVAPSHRITRRREADNKSKYGAQDEPSSRAKAQRRKALPRF